MLTPEMQLPLPSYLAAVTEAAGVLLLLSHPRCRQHAHASTVIGAFAILALCETIFALLAVDGGKCTEDEQQLTYSLLTIMGWCFAAQPLAVALFVQGRATPASDSEARANLLVRMGAVYLAGTVSADLFARELPLYSDHAHNCARLNKRGGLEVWSHEAGSSDVPPWWAAPDSQGQACLLLVGVALSELQPLFYAAVLVVMALGAQATPVLAGWSRGDGGWWPAGLCVTCVLVAEPLYGALCGTLCGVRRSAGLPAHPVSVARLVGCAVGVALFTAVALLAAWHRAEALFWLQVLQPSELALLCFCGVAPTAFFCVSILELTLLRVCDVHPGALTTLEQAAYEVQPSGGPNRCLAPGTHLPPLNGAPPARLSTAAPRGWRPTRTSRDLWDKLPPPPPATPAPPVVELAPAVPRPALPRALPRPPRLRTPRRHWDDDVEPPLPIPTPQSAPGQWAPPIESWRARGPVPASSICSTDGRGGRGVSEVGGEAGGNGGGEEDRGTSLLWTSPPALISPSCAPGSGHAAATALHDSAPRDSAPRDSAPRLPPSGASLYASATNSAPRSLVPRSKRFTIRLPWEDPPRTPRCGSSHLILPREEEEGGEEEETQALRQVFSTGLAGLNLGGLDAEAEAAGNELCAAVRLSHLATAPCLPTSPLCPFSPPLLSHVTLLSPRNPRPPQLWRGFEAIFFAFCAFASPSPPHHQPGSPFRPDTRVPVWRLEAAGFGSLCAACGLLGLAESPAIFAEVGSSPLYGGLVMGDAEAETEAVARQDDLGFEVAPLLRALVRIALRKAGLAGGASPQEGRMRGKASTGPASMAASLEAVVGQLARRMSASTRGVAQPLVLARGVRRAVRSVRRFRRLHHASTTSAAFPPTTTPPSPAPSQHLSSPPPPSSGLLAVCR